MTVSTDTDAADAKAQLLATAEAAEAAGDLDRALGFFRALAEIEPANPRWALEGVRVLRRSDRHPEATETLRRVLRKWPKLLGSPLFAKLLPDVAPNEDSQRKALGGDVPSDADLKRAPIEDDGVADVIIGRGSRRTAVLVFTGLADRIVMPLPLFDRYLAALDLTAVFLRDRKRIGFFNGVESLGDYDQTIAALKDRLAAMGIDTVHTIGNSAGGMAAVSYGLDLGAGQVLGFSAPVALTRDAADLDRRTAVFAERILGPAVPAERRDLRARALAADGSTRIHLYYGEEMPEDRYHAATMEGVPGVTLHPIAGLGGHGALFRLAEQRGLRQLFADTFGKAD